MAADPAYPNFDPDFFARVMKISAAVNVMLVIVAVAVLSAVTPDPGLCPGWQMRDAGATSAWTLVVGFSALPALWTCVIAARTKWSAQKVIESLRKTEGRYPFPSVIFPINHLVVTTMIVWSGFCTLPLFVILHECTSWFRL